MSDTYFVDQISTTSPTQNNTSQNKIIIADNLDALERLKSDFQNRVNLIYFDPPYSRNHGDTNHIDNYGNGFEWCDFLQPRLTAAKELLAEEGIICASIDDSRIHYLRLLLDQVFGEQNFINTIVWYYGAMSRHKRYHLRAAHEYVLVFSKALPKIQLNPVRVEKLRFRNVIQTVRRLSHHLGFSLQDGLDALGIHVDEETGDYYELYNTRTMKKDLFLQPCDSLWSIPPVNRMSREYVHGNMGQKPVRLVERILQVFGKPDSLVLDFFAGTGTTGEAVFRLNRLDGGHRSFILIQNNEPCREKVIIDQGYDTISDILLSRMGRVAHELSDLPGDFSYQVMEIPEGVNVISQMARDYSRVAAE